MKRNASEVEQQKHEEESYVDDFWIETVEVIKETSSAWYHLIEVNGKKIDFKLDSGADLTLITENTNQEIVPKPNLDGVNFKLNSPGGRVPIVGQFVAHSEHQGKPYKLRVTVAKVHNNLLSREVSEAMGLLRRAPEVNDMYGSGGLLKTEDPTRIQLKDNAQPYNVNTPRRIAFLIMSKVEDELNYMEKEGIISIITSETTDWCAPMCPVIKT